MTDNFNKQEKNDFFAIIISAPSGTGKTTVIKNIIERVRDVYCSVSTTSRKPREGEIQNLDYNFVERQEFENLIKNNNFFEYDVIYDNFYGTEKSQIDKAISLSKDIIFDISWQGASQIVKNLDAVSIYLLPPSLEELKSRLLFRGKDEEKSVIKRLKMASEEVKESVNYDYVIVNHDIERTTNYIAKIIEVERIKRISQEDAVKALLVDFAEFDEIDIDLK